MIVTLLGAYERMLMPGGIVQVSHPNNVQVLAGGTEAGFTQAQLNALYPSIYVPFDAPIYREPYRSMLPPVPWPHRWGPNGALYALILMEAPLVAALIICRAIGF